MKRQLAKLNKKIPSGLITIIILVGITYLSLSSNPLNANEMHLFVGADKIAHFGLYFVATILIIFDIAKSRLPHRFSAETQFLITALISVYGGIMEYLQASMNLGRNFEVLDIVANTLGAFVALALLLFWLMHKYRTLMVPLYNKHRHHHRHHRH